MEKSYNFGLVFLSVVVATAGAYVAVEIAKSVRETTGRRRILWSAGGAIAMGLGIWSMHFIAMLALRVTGPVWYDAPLTGLSAITAVAGCAVAFGIFDRARVTRGMIAIASVFMGLAIAGMHYIGMAGMVMSAQIHYDPLLVTASVAVAIVVSFAALMLTRALVESRGVPSQNAVKTSGAAFLMGLAVVSMHYTGMAAATFISAPAALHNARGLFVDTRYLGVVVGVVSLALLAVAFASTQFERWRLQVSSRISSLLELSPQVVWSANAAGVITDANTYWHEYTGLTRDQSLGEKWVTVVHPEDVESTTGAWRTAVETRANLEMELRFKRADGSYRWFLSRGRPVLNDTGEVIRWIGIAIDIEERKSAEQDAQAANIAKSEFLASMSHELRTPLNAIGGYAELLELGIRGPVNAAQIEDLSRIKRSQQHLLGLINDVLNFAKIDAGRVEYRISDVAVAEAVGDTEAMIRPQIDAKGLTYEFDECASAGHLRADHDKFQQIVLNLLSNAVKFTEPGGSITVRCDIEGNWSKLRITDTGAGIPEEKIAVIFDPFIQLRQRFNPANHGVGLGLSISRDLARAMGGDLTVESVVGRGSTFTLTLPRAVVI
ncbi:MAG: MHYT domain-containing protein [Gemmatimonadaceae bacterium]